LLILADWAYGAVLFSTKINWIINKEIIYHAEGVLEFMKNNLCYLTFET